ncbi:MAG TPA: 3-hydroxyacyl-CoA dehydrogenase NAD-binding domain-containing protein [Thermoanaerobaculia bacterium]|nr:3-hydroxyacyl-CoA dehydrogenase NAD-binding domain-containing protein [Thermoanaerobaculia bacterium]
MADSFSLEVRDAVAVVRIDVPGSKVNVLSASLFDEMERMLIQIEADDAIDAVVLASGKPGTFIAGADLRAVEEITEAAAAEELSRRGHALLDRIARCSKPFVAAIDGAALGGGLEVALACRGRVATDEPRTVLALPEVTLGLLPGAGGTQRLPRLVGLADALPILLTGMRLRARRALAIGLVDALAPATRLLDEACALASELAAELAPSHGWKPSLWSARLGSPLARKGASARNRLLAAAPVRGLILARATRDVRSKTRGLMPAPFEILAAVRAGLAAGYRAGQQAEIAAFGRLVVSPEARNLLRLFRLTTEARKAPPTARAVTSAGVVGAGLMGEGIASVSLDLVRVVLADVDHARLEKARASIERTLSRRAESGAITEDEKRERSSTLMTAINPASAGECELVIEAVFEDLALKRKLFRELEAVSGPDAVLASNTSALPIAKIAEGLARPERVVGMHYFSPVPKMPLLEVVAPASAAGWAVDTAVAFGIRQGKVPIVVGDGPGFYTTRTLAPLLNEAMLLLGEGAPPQKLEDALRNFGFPVGPLTLLDEVGLDVAAHVSSDLGEAFAARGHRPSSALAALVGEGMLGRKSGRGFYLYHDGKKRGFNPAALKAIGQPAAAAIPESDIEERLVLSMVAEAARCLDDGILRSEEDGDLGAILGLGFPPFRGGPFAWSRSEGKGEVARRLDALAAAHGARFAPPAWFRE